MPSTFTVRLMSIEGGIAEDGVRSYTRVYQVESSAMNDEPIDVDAAVPFSWFSAYPTDPYARLKRKKAVQSGDLMYWTVTLEWDSKTSSTDRGTVTAGTSGTTPTAGSNTQQTAPTSRPWVLKWGSTQTERPLAVDVSVDELPVVNSAGQPFDPPVMTQATNTTLSITCFSASANEEKIRIYFNKVNSADFLGWPAGWARCTGYQITSVFENNTWYWQRDVQIEFKEDGWNPIKVLDAGTIEKTDPDGSGLKLRQIVDANGTPVSSPVPLDGAGARLAVGEDLVYLEFQGYYTADFSTIV